MSASALSLTLWASVSDDVEQRLSAAPSAPIKLRPHEWKSGDNLWIVTIGDRRVVEGMMKELQAKVWGSRSAKLFVRGQDGKALVATLQSKAA